MVRAQKSEQRRIECVRNPWCVERPKSYRGDGIAMVDGCSWNPTWWVGGKYASVLEKPRESNRDLPFFSHPLTQKSVAAHHGYADSRTNIGSC